MVPMRTAGGCAARQDGSQIPSTCAPAHDRLRYGMADASMTDQSDAARWVWEHEGCLSADAEVAAIFIDCNHAR